MSTKIYGGLRFKTDTLTGAFALFDRVKVGVQELVDRKNERLCLRHAIRGLDELSVRPLLGEPLNADLQEMSRQGPLWPASRAVRKRQAECRAQQRRDPEFDCDVALYLRAHPQGHGLLGYLQEESVGVRNWLLGLPEVEDYAYWSNAAPPGELSELQWQARKEAWHEALGCDRACLELHWQPTGALRGSRAELLRDLAEVDARAHRLTRNRILTDAAVMSLMTEQERAELKATASFSGLMCAVQQAEQLLADPASDWAKRFEQLKAAILPALRTNLTEEVLRRPVALPANALLQLAQAP